MVRRTSINVSPLDLAGSGFTDSIRTLLLTGANASAVVSTAMARRQRKTYRQLCADEQLRLFGFCSIDDWHHIIVGPFS